MPDLICRPLSTETVTQLRNGGADAYGRPPERHRAEGPRNPCRHCLNLIPEGAEMLILAHRPFTSLQPYAETGPIFLCAADCPAWQGTGLPPMLVSSDYILRAYSADERILYGTGKVTPTDEILDYAATLLADRNTAFVDIRSSRNNCFQTRILRAELTELT